MRTQVEIQSLKSRVEEVINEMDSSDAAEANARLDKATTTLVSSLKRFFGVDVDPSTVFYETHEADWVIARVEEYEFGVIVDDDWDNGLVVLRRCSACSGFAVRSAHSIGDLASALRGPVGYPHGSGDCVKKNAPPQTAAERLLSALRDFIAENSYQG